MGKPGAFEQDAVLTMNFSSKYDWIADGLEWRGVRTKAHSYTRWLDGTEELFDLESDPLEMTNLVGDPQHRATYDATVQRMRELQHLRGDELLPCETYRSWYDSQRRVIRKTDLKRPSPKPRLDFVLKPQIEHFVQVKVTQYE